MNKRVVRAGEITRDIHAGMSDAELMRKYALSEKQLSTVLSRLADAGLITDLQALERRRISASSVMRAFNGVEEGEDGAY